MRNSCSPARHPPVGMSGTARRSKNMLSECRRFLEALFANKRNDLYILIWILLDKKSHWFQKVDEAIEFVESLHQQDVYVGTGLSAIDHGPYSRCKSDEIV